MKDIKIWFADFWPEWGDENFITPILKRHFNVILDHIHPDVVFHSIFGGADNANYYSCKKFLYLGENKRPSRYNTTYSISFDPHSDNNFRPIQQP